MAHPVRIARVYDPSGDGTRLLVDRLWPRGVARDSLHLSAWPREAAPSDALRRWFHADRSRWPEFAERYRAELEADPQATAACLDWCRRGPVTLLTAARDPDRSHVPVLRDHLLHCLGGLP